jgi:RNA polymerase sigma-70 factor (ECF subfamily)
VNDPGRPAEQSQADATLAIAGDRAAFHRLVHATARLVLATILLDVRDPHLADDLTQETYLRAWRSIARLHEPAHVNAWLIGIAKTVCIDAHRHQTRKKRAGILAVRPLQRVENLTEAPDPAPGPLDHLTQADQRQQLIATLQSLPIAQRDVLAMRYLAGADYATIAKQLDLTDGALRGLLRRGLTTLRETFAREELAGDREPNSPKGGRA